MTDRELLELAAKACELKVWGGVGHQAHMLFTQTLPDTSGKVTGVEWNPLTDDGDALRLAVKLELQLDLRSHEIIVYGAPDGMIREPSKNGNAAARRAIVRAAAEMGKQK